MCRYAFKEYKSHFVCFNCRKGFKKVTMKDFFEQRGLVNAYTHLFLTRVNSRKYREYVSKHGTDTEKLKDEYLAAVSKCPQCGNAMSPMGLDFRAPAMDDKEAWIIIQSLYEHGMAFTGCGCSVGYAPPAKFKELPSFLDSQAKKTEGQSLLESISRKLQCS